MIHLVGLPHTQFDREKYSTCAYTTKSVRLAEMLSVYYDVTVYWAGPVKAGSWGKTVSTMGAVEQRKYFGKWDPSKNPGSAFDDEDPGWNLHNTRALAGVRARWEPGDILAVVAGSAQQRILDAFPGQIRIEPEVGYKGLARDTFACFESYAWMHHVYGLRWIEQGRAFDTVIPNFQDPSDFEVGTDEGYLLYLGRHINLKGIQVAGEIADRAGKTLFTAGPGAHQEGDEIVTDDGCRLKGTYLGTVEPKERKRLLSHASALLVPTLYIEPFATVHIEAMMSGVPVIAPDYGVFTETLDPMISGVRYRMLREAVQAVEDVRDLRGTSLRNYAVARYSTFICGAMYHNWIDRLLTLQGEGWYAK